MCGTHTDDPIRLRNIHPVRRNPKRTESARNLDQALALAQWLGNRPARAANLIRLATAHQYLGRHDDTETEFREALQLCGEPECMVYEDFAWQHLGKYLVEM
jgi:hypothetical protein